MTNSTAQTKHDSRSKKPYVLPTIFTAGTIFCGFVCLMKTVQAISLPAAQAAEAARLFDHAAIAIGLAILTDGLDGRIARLTNAVSDFGRELDSLADVITFGAAPATLAFAWGIRYAELAKEGWYDDWLPRLGYFLAFMFLTSGAARLARFNIQKNPKPMNPGRPDRRYFVGLPIPTAAGIIASVVHFQAGHPIQSWVPWGLLWLALLAFVSFLMVSSWRWVSFKEISLLRMPTALAVLTCAAFIFVIWNFSRPVLLAMAVGYTITGIATRIEYRWKRGHIREPEPADATADT